MLPWIQRKCRSTRTRCYWVLLVLLILTVYGYSDIADLFYDDSFLRSPRPAVVYASVTYTHRRSGSQQSMTQSRGQYVVPRIIHQTWRSVDIPLAVVPWVSSWLKQHQEWEYWFWSYADIRKLVKKRFPHLLTLYDSYPSDIHRVNAFKYMVILEYGGVFADIDMESLKPLDGLIKEQDCLLSQEPLEHAHFLHDVSPPLVSNAVIACRRGHPFLRYVVAGLPSHVGWVRWNTAFHATGSAMLTSAYKRYTEGSRFKSNRLPVVIAEPGTFQPVIDVKVKGEMQNRCLRAKLEPRRHRLGSEKAREICAQVLDNNYTAQISQDSYAVHHWEHRLTTGSFPSQRGNYTNSKKRDYFTFTNSNGVETKKRLE